MVSHEKNSSGPQADKLPPWRPNLPVCPNDFSLGSVREFTMVSRNQVLFFINRTFRKQFGRGFFRFKWQSIKYQTEYIRFILPRFKHHTLHIKPRTFHIKERMLQSELQTFHFKERMPQSELHMPQSELHMPQSEHHMLQTKLHMLHIKHQME